MNKFWKNISYAMLAIGFAFSSVSCEEKEEEKKENSTEEANEKEEEKEEELAEKEAWPEMEAFHEFMAGTFHPSEHGDLAPLKEKARAMADAAATWAASTVPAGYPENVGETLVKLQEESTALADLVEAEASDEELTNGINALHDRFHEVVEKCFHDGTGHAHGKGHGEHKCEEGKCGEGHDHGHDH